MHKVLADCRPAGCLAACAVLVNLQHGLKAHAGSHWNSVTGSHAGQLLACRCDVLKQEKKGMAQHLAAVKVDADVAVSKIQVSSVPSTQTGMARHPH